VYARMCVYSGEAREGEVAEFSDPARRQSIIDDYARDRI